MNKDKYWESFSNYLNLKDGFDEYSYERIKDIFFCGWEAYERAINDSGLVLSNIESLTLIADNADLLSKFKRNKDSEFFVLTPTKSEQPLYSTSEAHLMKNIEHYKRHSKEV